MTRRSRSNVALLTRFVNSSCDRAVALLKFFNDCRSSRLHAKTWKLQKRQQLLKAAASTECEKIPSLQLLMCIDFSAHLWNSGILFLSEWLQLTCHSQCHLYSELISVSLYCFELHLPDSPNMQHQFRACWRHDSLNPQLVLQILMTLQRQICSDNDELCYSNAITAHCLFSVTLEQVYVV